MDKKKKVIVKEVMQNANQIVEVQITTRPKTSNVVSKPGNFKRNCLLKQILDKDSKGKMAPVAACSDSNSQEHVLEKGISTQGPKRATQANPNFQKRSKPIEKPSKNAKTSSSSKPSQHSYGGKTWAEILAATQNRSKPDMQPVAEESRADTHQPPTAAAAATPLEQGTQQVRGKEVW